ncbi:MAG: DUF1549 and DUF1553 domain-containing protein, partial [Gemmataceae bacterium]
NRFHRPSTVYAAFLFVMFGAPFARAEAVVPPAPGKVDFERHLMGLFGKLGCNAGSCHGSFQGKGGLRLSLFGYAPEKDFMALTREAMGRRLNTVDAEQSLLLLKSAGLTEHGGGRRFGKDSWQYRMFRDWIAAGAARTPGSGAVQSIAIEPAELAFGGVNESRALKVKATFANGDVEDITRFCEFRTNDDAIAEVDHEGNVSSKQAGDTAVVVSYRGNVLPVRALVPVAAPKGFAYPKIPEVNYVDQHVYSKLKRLNIVPSGQADDAEFLRRVYVDTIGSLPSPDEVRSFLASKDPSKRAKKIDELLAHPMHAALWATKFSDITGNNTDLLEQPSREKRSKMWHDWLRKRLEDNVPYDELVKGVLCATSRDGQDPEKWIDESNELEKQALDSFDTDYAKRQSLDLFWRRQQNNVPLEQWGEKTAAAFLGIRLECAQCHKHPFDRWTQHDYRAYANIFGQVSYGTSPEAKKAIDEENRKRRGVKDKKKRMPTLRELYISDRARALADPDTDGKLAPKALGGPVIAIKDEDARLALFAWMKQPDNPYFARSFVNRVWGHYLGVGIVEPIDDFSLANPPSNPQLLDALAKDFVEHKFDIRHIERVILNSRVYQQSSAPNETNKLDNTNYSHSYVRRMMAEVVLDVLNSALDVKENWGNSAPEGARAIEVAVSRVQNTNLEYAFKIFGRSARTAACDCERSLEPALPQTLYMMTDSGVLQKLQSGRLNELLKSDKTDEQILEELVLATLARFPTDHEKKVFNDYKRTIKDRKTLFVDTVWALINTREFILNH